MVGRLLSMATVATIGLGSKAFLKFGAASVTVNGLPTLLQALKSDERERGRGIITVSNHISTCDDPLAWGVLPASHYFSSRTTRWTLGASEVMFTNRFLSTFFRLGQTIETFRGKGIYQPAVDIAIGKLNQGSWLHLYSEGRVCQPNAYARDPDGNATLSRFKWGVGRIVMEADIPPVIIPVWLTGFDQVMPEGRPFPYNFMPRLGANISVSFGEPLPPDQARNAIGYGADVGDDLRHSPSKAEVDRVRSEITNRIRTSVIALGRKVSGPSLS